LGIVLLLFPENACTASIRANMSLTMIRSSYDEFKLPADEMLKPLQHCCTHGFSTCPYCLRSFVYRISARSTTVVHLPLLLLAGDRRQSRHKR